MTTALIEESLRLRNVGSCENQMWDRKAIEFIDAVLPLVATQEARGTFDREMLCLGALDAFASSDVDSSVIAPIRNFLLSVPSYRLAADRGNAPVHPSAEEQFGFWTMGIRCLKTSASEQAHA